MLIIFLFVAVIAKLFYLQIFQSEELQILAIDQWARDIPITAERGNIYDANGTLLADTATSYSIYVRPSSVKDKSKVAQVLANVLGLNVDSTYNKINAKVSEVTITKKANAEQISLIYSKDVTGVYYSQNIVRKYIYGDFLATVLGFVNVDGIGQTGIESYYNDYLQGIDGYVLTETDLVGREIESGMNYYVKGEKGCDVYLTIDYAIQNFVQNAVNSAYLEHQAKSASCMIMNAKTGEVVAMAQAPSYNLNELPRDNLELLLGVSKNTLISNVYEPGSTFKILTAATGLENGAVNVDSTRCYCPGYRIVDGNRIKCWRTIGHGSQTFSQAVENSCNCMFMDIAQKLGVDTTYDALNKFGITEKTGIDASGEGKGLTISQSLVKNVDLARIGFGQAVAVTAIELLTASCSVINGGELLTPFLVKEIVNNDGEVVYKGEKKVRRKVVSERTSELMRGILEGVVNNGGGKNAKVEGFRIGGKTGTAQKYATTGGIAAGKYVATFMGFAPADNPEYILLFIVDEPSTGVYYGSMVAAPSAAEIFRQLLEYKGYERSGIEKKEEFFMPNLEGMSITQASAELKKMNLYFEYKGEVGDNQKVVKQIPVNGSYVTEDTVVYLEFE